MVNFDTLSIIFGIVFAVDAFLANAYWEAAVKWSEKGRMPDADEETRRKAIENRNAAEKKVQICSGLAIITIVLAAVPIYLDVQAVLVASKWLLLLPLIGTLFIIGKVAIGRPDVSID